MLIVVLACPLRRYVFTSMKCTLSPPRPLDREFRRFIHREHVVAIDGHGRNTVALGLLGEILTANCFSGGVE